MGTEGTHLYGDRAPHNLQYVVLVASANLTQERVLTGTTNQIVITDNGAGSTVVLSTPQNIHTGASPTFAGLTLGSATDYATFAVAADGALTVTTVDADASNAHISFMPDGYFGIGVADPLYLFDCQGAGAHERFQINATAGSPHFQMVGTGPGYFNFTGTAGHHTLIVRNRTEDADLYFGVNVGGSETTILTIDGPTGNAGIRVTDPHSALEVNGAISSATVGLSAAGPTDNLDVSGVNTIFIDTSGNNVTLGGTTGGVDGQVLSIVIHDATNDCTIEHAEGTGNQDFYLHAGLDETLSGEMGGWVFVNHGGGHWHDASHAKHV